MDGGTCLASAGPIRRGELDERDYLPSLLAAGQARGLIGEEVLRRVGEDALLLLKGQAERYTGGGSGSVRTETAQALLRSVLYTAGLELKTVPPERALARIRTEGLPALFAAGQGRLFRRLRTAQAMHRRLTASLFFSPNVFWRSTAVDGIGGFFRLYRPALFADEVEITADYPVLFRPDAYTGLEFIERYLQAMMNENAFLRCFASDTVDRLLCGACPDYAVRVTGLFAPAATAAIAAVLTGRGHAVRRLRHDPVRLSALLRGSADEVCARMGSAADEVCRTLALPAAAGGYLRRSVPRLCADARRAARYGALSAVCPLPVE